MRWEESRHIQWRDPHEVLEIHRLYIGRAAGQVAGVKTRIIYGAVGVLAIVLGADNIITGKGSLIFGTHATVVYGAPKVHYTGPLAYIEGAIFIAVGIFCLFRAWSTKTDQGDE